MRCAPEMAAIRVPEWQTVARSFGYVLSTSGPAGSGIYQSRLDIASRSPLRVTTGHSAMSAQCPVCPKAEMPDIATGAGLVAEIKVNTFRFRKGFRSKLKAILGRAGDLSH